MGSLFKAFGPLTDDLAAAIFTQQATALAAGGVNFLWVETLTDEAAVVAACATGLLVVCTMSYDTHKRTMMGLAPSGDLAVKGNCGVPFTDQG